MENFAFNRDFGDIDPCGVCLEIINDVFTDPVPEEDLREIEPTADDLYAVFEGISHD